MTAPLPLHPDRWLNLAPYWPLLSRLAAERDQRKRGYASTRDWARDPHFVGMAGEMAYALATGREPDFGSGALGDGGRDFVVEGRRVDVKTSLFWEDAYLKVYPSDLRADDYVLVALDRPNRRAQVLGKATREMVAKAPLMDRGYGPSHNLHFSQLEPIEYGRVCPGCGAWVRGVA